MGLGQLTKRDSLKSFRPSCKTVQSSQFISLRAIRFQARITFPIFYEAFVKID